MRTTEFAYKQDHPFEKRSAEAARIREKYVAARSLLPQTKLGMQGLDLSMLLPSRACQVS